VSVRGCAKIKGFALLKPTGVTCVCVCVRERECVSAAYFKNQALILAKKNWVLHVCVCVCVCACACVCDCVHVTV